jgi:hypothetical protein
MHLQTSFWSLDGKSFTVQEYITQLCRKAKTKLQVNGKALALLETTIASDLAHCMQANGMSKACQATARLVLTPACADMHYAQSGGNNTSDVMLLIVPSWLPDIWGERVCSCSGVNLLPMCM